MTSSIPTSIPLSGETVREPTRRYDFDHIPQLGPHKPGDIRGSLLPKEGGRPGFTYAQIPLKFARQAEAAGWYPMIDACRYTIIGPKGSIDMELMAQGRLIPGLSGLSSKRVCFAPMKLICEATGLDPRTGFPPTSPQEDPTNGQETNPSLEAGSEPSDPEREDPQGSGGPPGEGSQPGSRHGKGHTRRS